MKKILIYTIFRDSAEYIDIYHSQIRNIVYSFPDIDFYFSAYENDSVDGTGNKLLEKDWSFFRDYSIISENLNTPKFGSVMSEERVMNLANARNKAVYAKNFVSNVDYVLMIESDIIYDIRAVEKILNFEKVEEFDIVSGFTWHIENNEFTLYDKWATRKTNALEYYRNGRGKVFIDLPENWKKIGYAKYKSTSNGICLYKSEPFKEGIKHHHISRFTDDFDCEMAVLCEKFIDRGYNKIYIIHSALIEHAKPSSDLVSGNIPKIIWQTYKTKEKDLPTFAKEAANTWKDLNPEYDYRYFSDIDIKKFIIDNYDSEILELFNSFKVPVMKADLWRYLVIYKMGGVYCDIDTLCKNPIRNWIPHNATMVVAPENGLHYAQWVFAASPENPVLKNVIDVIVERCKTIDYSKKHFVHYYTGPDAFTTGIRDYFNLPDLSHECRDMQQEFNCYCGLLQNEAKDYVYNNDISDSGFFCYGGRFWDIFRETSVKHLFGSMSWANGEYQQWVENPLAKKSRTVGLDLGFSNFNL